MIVSIDECSSDPLYKQIHDQIIAGIATGELEPGMVASFGAFACK